MAPVEIVSAPSGEQPFPVEVVVFEEDTHMVMSAGNRVTSLPETTDASLSELAEFTPRAVGDLIRRGNGLYAIVHDFDKEPSFDPDGARQALSHLATLAAETGFEYIAIQAFRYPSNGDGSNARARAMAEIQRALAGTPVKRVWLIAS